MFAEHAYVELKRAIPRLELLPGALGVVVHVYPDLDTYEVEFVSVDGSSLGVETVAGERLQLAISPPDRRCSDRSDLAVGRDSPGSGIAAYPLDDGPLSEQYVAALRADVGLQIPRGALIVKESLFETNTKQSDSTEPLDGVE